MKQKKGMLILTGILGALLILYAGLCIYNRNAQKEKADKEEAEKIYLADVETDEMESLEYTDGENTMSFVKEEDQWYCKEDREIELVQDKVEEIAKAVADLTAVRRLQDHDELSDYGLEKPGYTIRCRAGNGEKTIAIGDMTGENYYATVGDTGEVYTIAGDILTTLSFEMSDVAELDNVPTIGSGNIEKVEVSQNGETTGYTEDGDLQELAGGFGVLELSDCVDFHATEEELGGYGLDEENRITASADYKDSESGETENFTVYIGGTDDSGTYRYVMAKDSIRVYRVSKEIVDNMITVGEGE